MLDPFANISTILFYELKEKEEEGCEVEEFKNKFKKLVGNIPENVFKNFRMTKIRIPEEELKKLYEEVTKLEPQEKRYVEPFEFQDILNLSPGCLKEIPFSSVDLKDKIYGAWLGRCAGCLLGKPVEGWSKEKIERYLKEVGEYLLQDYFPKPKSKEYEIHPESKGALRGHITHMIRDDDIDYTILNLNIIERLGKDFSSIEIAHFWLQNLPYEKTYTAERIAYKNFVNGVWPPDSGRYYNPYREWIGAQIRGDVFGWINPGKLLEAAKMAYRDAIISHRKNGVYGEMFVAAATAAALVLNDPAKVIEVIELGLSVVPERSRFSEAVRNTLKWAVADEDWKETFAKVLNAYGKYHPVHTIINAAIVVLALIHGRGDYEKSVCIAVMCGHDTDCNGATVGSIVGALNGASQLPDKWIRPLNDKVESIVASNYTSSISVLAERTLAIIEK